ncbi:MAG TPA: recombinase RecA, partial [Polyangiaceae bacterium]
MSDNTKRSLEISRIIGALEKAHGKGAIMRLGEGSLDETVATISTGSLALDHALGIGGYPQARIIEIYGPESSGKTTLALHAIAQVQRQGGVAAFIDAEHAFDVRYARGIGVDVNQLLMSQPDHGEQALDIVDALARSEVLDLVVVDSVAALVPKAEIEGDMGDQHVGLQARLMSQALRKLTAIANRQRTTIIFINQLRMKIGVMFGSPETTTGGNALKFYSSVRLDVRRIGKVMNGEAVVGNRTKVKVVKNKCAPPFTEAEFDIRWGRGIDEVADLIETAVVAGALDKSGSHLLFDGKSIGQGRERARDALLADPQLRARLREATVSMLGAASPTQALPARDGGDPKALGEV